MSRIWMALTGRGLLRAHWRGPVFALLFWTPWSAVVTGLVVALVLIALTAASAAVVSMLQLYGGLALALAMTSGSISRVLSSDRRLVLFQRPGSLVHHYLRVWLLAYACMALAISGVWAVGQPFSGQSGHLGLPTLVGALLFATMAFAAGALATAVVRSGEAVLVVAWAVAPVIVTVVGDRYALGAEMRAILEWPFVPFNAVFQLQQSLVTGSWAAWKWYWGPQLVFFPALCLSLAVLRLKRLSENGVA